MCQHSIYLWNVQNQKSIVPQQDRVSITGADFEELLLKMGKHEGKYSLNPRDGLIEIFARQYHPTNVQNIMKSFQSPEQEFFTRLLSQGEEKSSFLSDLMQSIVEETVTSREATCGCYDDDDPQPGSKPKAEMKPIWHKTSSCIISLLTNLAGVISSMLGPHEGKL